MDNLADQNTWMKSPFLKGHSLAYRWWGHLELEKLYSMIGQSIPAEEICRVLDVGAGSGLRHEYWQYRYPNSEHVVLDINFADLRQNPLEKRVLANGELLPFRDQQFDLVIGFATFHHFSSPSNGMLECIRVGKALAFLEPLDSRLVRLMIRLGIIAEYEEGERIARFDLRKLRLQFENLGYQFDEYSFLHKHIVRLYGIAERINSLSIVRILAFC